MGAKTVRLLFVSHDCYEAGAQQSLLRILRWLRNHTDWTIGVLALGDGPLAPVYASLVPFLILPDPAGEAEGALDRVAALTGGPPDIICGNTAVSARSYGLLSAFSAPMVTRVAELDDSMARYVDVPTRTLLLRHSDAFVAVSTQVAEMLTVRMGISPDRITVINGAVEAVVTRLDAPRRAALLKRLGLAHETRLLWGCGSVSRRKGSDLFLGVTEALLTFGVRDFHALWAGHPVDDLAATLFLTKERSSACHHVTFLGQVSEPNLLMAPGDIFLLTSREDPFPLVSLEAAERGLPTLCFPGCGGMEAFVRDGGGLVSAGSEPEDMARLVQPLLENPARAIILGQEARELVLARHSMDSAGPEFVALFERLGSGADECVALATRSRLIAFHLPQFHTIPENDTWWGKGFTEWTNVKKAQPLFDGHYQPHVPADLGYYDLSDPSALKAQAALGQKYGIHGFCFYHYWFNGKLLLETPLHQMLKSGEPDFPFCLCWANENWTRAWDGRSGEVLIGQNYTDADDARHIHYLSHFFDDHRYIRIDGKPLFLVYRANQIPNPLRSTMIWREEARKLGHELYLCRVESFRDERTDPTTLGFDASVEFQPDWAELDNVEQLGLSSISGDRVYRYADVVQRMMSKQLPGYRRFPCVCPSWDNSPRRKSEAVILHDSSPQAYKIWLQDSLKKVHENRPDERIVFVNAWNEWGEGNHLEPDAKYGDAYLEATRSAIMEDSNPGSDKPISAPIFVASIIIPVFNKVEFTQKCIHSVIRNTAGINFEVIIIDNNSEDGTKEYLTGLSGDVKVVTNDENVGYTIACNQGARIASGKHLVFLNNDTEPQPGWLEQLITLAESDATIGAVGAKLVYPNGVLQEAGGMVFRDARGWNFGNGDNPDKAIYNRIYEVDYCSGACLLVKHDLFNKIGGFDEQYAPAYYEETDLCFSLRKQGYKTLYNPNALVIHHESITAGRDIQNGYKKYIELNRLKFAVKWDFELKMQDTHPSITGKSPFTADRARLYNQIRISE